MTGPGSPALVDDDVVLGEGVVIWGSCQVRAGARIGAQTTLGTAAYVGADVVIGERCKVKNAAQIFEGSRLGDGVFIGPGAILTNDRYPRAITAEGDLKGPYDWVLAGVTVETGASVGAGVVVVAGVRVGAWSMVGAGAVVTRSVARFELVAGNPARRLGWVCRCGHRVDPPGACPVCGRRYALDGETVVEDAPRSLKA